MNRRKRKFVLCFLLLLVLIGTPAWVFNREVRQSRLDLALIEAIKAGDKQKALSLLSQGANGAAKENDKPPTMTVAMLRLLDHIRHPAPSPSGLPGNDDHLPALVLLYNGSQMTPDTRVVSALLDHGASINDRNAKGYTILESAALCSNEEIVKLLLARGVAIDSQDIYGETPLHLANAEVTKILLEHGANIETKDENGQTPLIFFAGSSIWFGNGDGDVSQPLNKLRVLLEHGANIEARDSRGQTPLLAAFHFDAVRLLLEHGADIEAKYEDGATPLICAVGDGNVAVVRTLLEHGAKVSAKTNHGNTVLDIAKMQIQSSQYHAQSPGSRQYQAARYQAEVKIAALLHQYGAK